MPPIGSRRGAHQNTAMTTILCNGYFSNCNLLCNNDRSPSYRGPLAEDCVIELHFDVNKAINIVHPILPPGFAAALTVLPDHLGSDAVAFAVFGWWVSWFRAGVVHPRPHVSTSRHDLAIAGWEQVRRWSPTTISAFGERASAGHLR